MTRCNWVALSADYIRLIKSQEKKYCSLLYEVFAKVENINTVVLANRFTDIELTMSYIENLLDFWSTRYRKVVLFSPMPEFHHSNHNFIRTGEFSNNPSLEAHIKFFEIVDQVNMPKKVIVVNTKELFCGEGILCKGIENEELLLTDYGHLTLYGAQFFGKNLRHSIYWDFITRH